MNLANVMDELGTALETIAGLRVYPYSAKRITPPAAVVVWPEPYTFDATYSRGGDRCTLPVTVLAGNVDARTSRDLLAQYADGSGASSVKAAIDNHVAAAYDSARTASVEFEVYTVSGVEYLAATFQVEIIGSGS